MQADAIRSRAALAPFFTSSARRGLRSPTFRWSIAPALAAWLLLLCLAGQEHALVLCIAPRAAFLDGILAGIAASFATIDPVRWAGEWVLMITAMMFPLLVPAVGHVAVRSFAARRDRSAGLFVAGFALIWLAAAAAASIALVVVRASLASLGLAGSSELIACAMAALWQLTSAKERAANRCHGRVALRPYGLAADYDALRFGLFHGTRCVCACLPTMVLPLVGAHRLGTMAVVFFILLAERARQAPQYELSALALVVLGLTSLG